MEELTFRTPVVVGRFRQLESQQLRPDPVNDVLHVAAQPRREIDLNPAAWSAVPHIPMRYLDIEHFFKAQRLRAQLKVRGGSVPDARLVFDGTDRVAVDFDRIGAAGQSQRLGPEWNGPKHQTPSLTAMLPAIDPARRARASDGMGVVAPDAVAMDESALTREYTKCSMAEIGTTGSTFTTVRLRLLCPVRLASALEGDRLPSGVDAYSRPGMALLRLPGVQKRVDSVAVERLTQAGSRSVADRDSPGSSAIPSASLARRQSGRAAVGPETPYGQEGKTKE